jgi:hypothetical protein
MAVPHYAELEHTYTAHTYIDYWSIMNI